ncbi:MAG: cation-efflux pump, partial [Flavisolibacter sp.]|nr:cation-efflux pump [Flavisolibacter sp.]
AYTIARPAIDELMDASPDDEIIESIKKIALSVYHVIDIEKTYVRKTGSLYFVDIHVIVDGDLSVAEGHKIGHDVKDLIMTSEPRVKDVLVHIEPDKF